MLPPIVLNMAAMPALLALLVLASVLSAPVLPLFTLPLFLLGFPRPVRFWPYPTGHSANVCQDTVYYEQLAPHLAASLHSHLQALGGVRLG